MGKTLRPLNLGQIEEIHRDQQAPAEKAEAFAPPSDVSAELEKVKQLIDAYCMETFDQGADYSNLSHVDLAYSSTYRPYEDAELSELLSEAAGNLHAEIMDYEMEELDEENDRSIPADPEVKNFSYSLVDGKVFYRENSRMFPVEVSVTAENRMRGMIALRECVRRLIEFQTETYPEEDIQVE